MRTYTSIDQSKALANIFPWTSADMCHIQECYQDEYKPYYGDPIPAYGQDKVRGWSLGALMSLITKMVGPCDIEFSSESGNEWTCRLFCKKKDIDLGVVAGNQTDALYDIICWLKSNNKI